MELDNHVDVPTKKKRARLLLEVSKELEINYFNKFINTEVDVLIEEVKNGSSYGHTSNFLHVKINRELEHNTTCKVKLKNIEYPYIIGE